MAPAPPVKTSNAFSNRISNVTAEGHTRIAIAPGPKVGAQLAMAVIDQLLVSPSVLTPVLNYLNNTAKVPSGQIGTVFQGLRVAPADDVAIVKLEGMRPLFNAKQPLSSVFSLTDQLRRNVLGSRNPELIAPNRVLVPAPVGAGCPYGPPSPAPDVSLAPPPGPEPEITVIDSGYQNWWTTSVVDPFGRQWGPWGTNPLAVICNLLPVKRAQYLTGNQPLAQLTAAYNAGTLSWNDGTPDVPATVRPNTLDALAGHANFVAGVVAQICDYPTIHLWSHNASFVAGSDDFPVEASVCRSIVHSQEAAATKVIHVGFAFPLRARSAVSASLAGDFLSVVWEKTFRQLTHNPVVVAPAGNESEIDPHYPAALPSTYPNGPYRNVVGVASLSPVTDDLSTFTNYGPWVRCSAVGENVQSTFFPAKHVQCEEDPGGPSSAFKDFADKWASWNGSSFAAPKVAGAIAARIAAGAAPPAAWTALTHVYGHPGPHPGAGYRFTNL